MAPCVRGNDISMIFQEPMSSLNPIYTVGSQIVEAIRVHRKVSRKAALGAGARAAAARCSIPEPEAAARAVPAPALGRSCASA